MTTALDVASYIQHSQGLRRHQSMDLQKLLYFAQAWHLAWTGRPIFSEQFEAWPKGPVARSVFRENRYRDLPESPELDDETKLIIDAVISHYDGCSVDELVALTHADAPWIEARKTLGPNESSRNHLSEKTMLDFYTAKTLAGENAPRRPACVSVAREADVAAAGASVIDRWREGLELLAHK